MMHQNPRPELQFAWLCFTDMNRNGAFGEDH